jgi:hypothetical protein
MEMENQTQQSQETSTLESSAQAPAPEAQSQAKSIDSASAPSDKAEAQGASGAEKPVVPAAQAPQAPSYQPNWKFRVAQKEYEIDEFLRGAIKDADTEKKVKELYEKAYGLDLVKPRFHETREKYQTLESSVKAVMSAKDKDLDKFFKLVDLPEEKLLKYVWDKLQYQQLPDEQRQLIEAQRTERERAETLEQKYQQAQEFIAQQAVQARTVELRSVLTRPEIQSVASAFDARVGQPGAFEAEVVARGKLAYYTTGKDIPAEQAVQEVLSILGHQQAQAPQAQATPAQPQQQQAPQVREKPPVIPAVSGRTTSPAFKAPESIEDLKRLARSHAAQS